MLSDQCAVGAATTPKAWAHADCSTRHKGCTGVGFSALESASAADKVVKANMELEAESKILLQEVTAANPHVEIKSEVDMDLRWSFDKNGKKIDPKTMVKRKAFYFPDGTVDFLERKSGSGLSSSTSFPGP